MRRIRRINSRQVGLWTVALAVWDVWRRIPRRHRKRILGQIRKHGPRLARNAYQARRRR